MDKQPTQWNIDMRFGTWNVRNLYRVSSLITVSRKLSKYKLDVVGVQEVRWKSSGTEPAVYYKFLTARGMRIINLMQFLVCA
jgi:exonuclease III